MKILNNKIGDNEKTFLIAEIGINHNGSIDKAIKMIDHAKDAGFDAVKFQTIVPELLMQKNTPLVEYQKKTNSENMFDLIKKYNFSRENFINLKKYCDNKKIIFLSTPFDNESAIFLDKINLPAFKISSTDNDNFLLLKKIKSFNKPIILSTGMMTHEELKKTLKFLNLKKNMLSILHCISEYPTPIQRAQVNSIITLKKFKYTVGFSDHTENNVCSVSAITLGAKIIEKHITLDKNMEGPDHSSSLECKDLSKFVSDIRELELMLKIKKRSLTKVEKENKLLAKKGLYYTKNILKNTKINSVDIIALRPKLNGISPSNINKILKKKIYKNVKKNNLIKLDDFIKKK